ncbi:hypothetical protein [Sphingomonas sp. Leaf25]|uniref:head-tail joining protein n=1 Tax=Sphingomonas sp. Leaf25 TaxID=1735692 RepID=UPI0006F3E37A|nr:hypothetical protein [Sphingomonas sp. Leaf25]KQN00566.1 hypothetical protein ASE78_05635 [Sphingomonas sp. Leaf25]
MIDWDAELLAPVMAIFGEGEASQPETVPVYTPRGKAPFPLPDAVFDREYRSVDSLPDGSEATTIKPVLGVRAALFAIPPKVNDTVIIPRGGGKFIVKDQQPDGHGHILLILMGPVP